MGRAIGLVVFVILFIIFAIVKASIQGGKAAYNAVFNPNAKDEAVMKLLSMIFVTVQEYMRRNYSGNTADLSSAVMKCTHDAQKLIEANGYNAPISITETIVKEAIATGGFATTADLARL